HNEQTPRQDIKLRKAPTVYGKTYSFFDASIIVQFIAAVKNRLNQRSAIAETSTLIPGPIVDVMTTFRIYVPLEDCGFAFAIVSTIVSKFSTNFSFSKESFPIGT